MISRSDDTPTSYAEALVTDDDDGNLANGTPNKCAIDRAFGRHGLGELGAGAATLVPEIENLSVRLAQLAPSGTPACAGPQIASASVAWELRSNPATKGTLDLALQNGKFAADLPSHPGEVIRYSLTATLDDGSILTWPRNPADPQYETYVGPVTTIYCTDFETDPIADGWTLQGFQWGVPAAAPGTTDPATGFAGAQLLGTTLAGTGEYAPGAILKATSPMIEVGGFTKVRLQYRRWLTVEDAAYDKATIEADGMAQWTNAETQFGGLLHRDGEWRFHDVDLTAAAADGKVQIAFGLTADEEIELGGWNIDALCIVGVPACGNGAIDGAEACDDGNAEDGDGCSATCTIETPGDAGGCCSSHSSGSGSLLLGFATGLLLFGRRRRR